MSSNAINIRLLLTVLLLSSYSVHAIDWSFRAPHDAVPENAEEYEWAEESTELPAFPEKEKMLQITFDRPNPRFKFFIDPETLSVGDDGVVRYVLMLRSPSGSENIMYEGIRCSKQDYKTIAFGTAKGKFRHLSRPRWKEITETSNNWFRRDLWQFYFCLADERLKVINRDNILRRIQNPNTILLK